MQARTQPGARVRVGLGCLLVMAFAAFLLGYRIGAVRAPIWDEAYYLTAAARLHEGRLQFASHPPLGLLLIAAGDRLAGRNAAVDWKPLAAVRSVSAEAMPPGFDYGGPRLAPVLAGVVAAVLFFLLMAELTGSPGLALMLSPLFLCDPALIMPMRAAQLDAFQLLFVLAALIAARRALQPDARLIWTGLFSAAIAAAAMVRLNALAVGMAGLLLLWPAVVARDWRRLAARTLAATLSAAIVIWGTFALMLIAAPQFPDAATSAGRIDLAHISHDYRAEPLPLAVTAYAADYAGFMADDLAALGTSDANSSHPWQWLTGGGGFTVRWDRRGERISTIAFVPNRPAWLVSLLGLLLWLAHPALRREPAAAFLAAAWGASMGVLVWLDHTRMMYAYHYLIPLMLGYALIARALVRACLPERLLWPALLTVTAWAAMTLPLGLHQPVALSQCGLFLPDCGDPMRRI